MVCVARGGQETPDWSLLSPSTMRDSETTCVIRLGGKQSTFIPWAASLTLYLTSEQDLSPIMVHAVLVRVSIAVKRYHGHTTLIKESI